MIFSWVVKIFLAVALIGAIGFEAGSPLITRAQVDDVAHSAADRAASEMVATKDANRARAVADEIVGRNEGMSLDRFTVAANGSVEVVVSKRAGSLLLRRFSQTADWYDISVTATSARTID